MAQVKIILKALPWILLAVLAVLFVLTNGSLFGNFSEPGTTYVEKRTLLERVEALGKMELVKYRFQEVVTLEEEASSILWGALSAADGGRVVLMAGGEAVGCVDLTKLDSNTIVPSPTGELVVHLPAPELCYYKLDMERTYIYEAEKGYMASSNDKISLIDSAYDVAEKEIKRVALESGILQQTMDNAELMLKPLFQEISGRPVRLVFPVMAEEGKTEEEGLFQQN